MFTSKTPVEPTPLEKEMTNVLSHLEGINPASDEYATVLDKLEKLNALKEPQKEPKKRISPDALVSAGASLLGIVLILSYEQTHVVTTKALSFITKPKI